jgi:hypothetical protein
VKVAINTITLTYLIYIYFNRYNSAILDRIEEASLVNRRNL